MCKKLFRAIKKKTGPKQPLQSFRTSYAYIQLFSISAIISTAVRLLPAGTFPADKP